MTISYAFDDSELPRHDRLGAAFCLALALHAAIILGISFNLEDRNPAATKLEITLAQHNSLIAPDKADYLAQSNQQGSGTLDDKAMLTTRELADFQDNTVAETSRQLQAAYPPDAAATQRLLSSTQALRKEQWQEQDAEQQQPQTALDEITMLQRQREIASLEAKLDIQQNAYAKRPRIRRLTSVATQQADDALYLHNWRTKIEAIGNQHYPEQAKRMGIYGDLRLVVSLLPNGDVHKVKVLKSSGHSVLDQAAIRIVHLAAPYDAFPRQMSSKVDVLEIIRTWRFHQGQLTSSS